MEQRPLRFISRDKELELIQRLLTIVDDSNFDPSTHMVLMVSPDYSATVAMHLAHAWSRKGEMLQIMAVDVPYPGENYTGYSVKFRREFGFLDWRPDNLILVEAGIIRGGNWTWLVSTLIDDMAYRRKELTLCTMVENVHTAFKSDYVAEYYDDTTEDLTFYYERFNKAWPIR